MNKNYIVYNVAGDILRTGTCPADHLKLQAGPGEFVMEGEARDDRHRIERGRVVDKPAAPAAAPSFDELRRAAYPPLLDFADAYYWQQNGDPGPMQAWLAQVKAVKDRYPKPQ